MNSAYAYMQHTLCIHCAVAPIHYCVHPIGKVCSIHTLHVTLSRCNNITKLTTNSHTYMNALSFVLVVFPVYYYMCINVGKVYQVVIYVM